MTFAVALFSSYSVGSAILTWYQLLALEKASTCELLLEKGFEEVCLIVVSSLSYCC